MTALLPQWLWWRQEPLEPLAERQQLVAILLAGSMLLLVLELVRRRKLREEYSWVWVATSIALMALAAQQDLVLLISGWLGSATATSTLFFGAILFLLLLALQFSVRLSKLTFRHKTLAQRTALLEQELERLRNASTDANANGAARGQQRHEPPPEPQKAKEVPAPPLYAPTTSPGRVRARGEDEVA